MGLITGLLTLPLAPVRGTIWIGERVQEQAEAELYNEDTIREQLLELEEMRGRGEVPEEDIAAAEDELIALLMEIRGGHGTTLE
jgi:hypothetical protein